MRNDVIAWSAGTPTRKLVSKETLNHPGLIELVSGLDVYRETSEAYRRAYEALGIDLVNRVPTENAPLPTPPGEIRRQPSPPYDYAHLGVYDTAMRNNYLCASPREVYELDISRLHYRHLITPVPHPCSASDIGIRQAALGEVGLYYPMLYTTLFMWGVEFLGWEIFMLAATLEPDRFHQRFLLPVADQARRIVDAIAAASDSPFVFVHDDLASAAGPLFRPAWYERYIFPHYPEIWGGAKRLGKKVIFVADGNMSVFLSALVDAGVDGLMFEAPATPWEAVIEHFGCPGRYFIGGVDTSRLTFGTPGEIREMVVGLHRRATGFPGFALASGGGLHGNIPLSNLEAYFDARAEIGATPVDWRTRCRRQDKELAHVL